MKWGIELPGLLSILAHRDPAAEVIGLDRYPEEDWPPVLITHLAFQLMVAIGMLMALLAVCYFWFLKKGSFPRWFLWALVGVTPLGMLAIEAGWVVTEVGRQPWIIYEILRTEDGVTPVPGMVYHFYLFVVLYLGLAVVTAWLFGRQIRITQGKLDAS